MIELGIDECVTAIRNREKLHASVNNGAFFIKIEDYTHFVCTAIHNGHNLRSGLLEKRMEEMGMPNKPTRAFGLDVQGTEESAA